MSTRIRPNPISTEATRASPRIAISATANPQHTYRFICILSISTSCPIIISFFINSSSNRNKINSSRKIPFFNITISIRLISNKMTFFINIIYCNISMINSFFKKIYRIISCIFINNNYISN